VQHRRENREPSRWARARYRANRFWDRGTWPVLLAVGALTLLIVIASTVVLVLTNSVFTTEHRRTVAERFWQSLLRVIDPGTIATDIGWGPRLLSLAVTVSGIVLFGTLIGTISTRMQIRLSSLRRGRTIVLEKGHIVILGWTPSIGLLVDDLTAAVATRLRRQHIVILANEDRATMEDSLRDTDHEHRGRWLICRNGDPTVASELDRVNVRNARTVVAIGTEEPSSDATVAATVLAVGVACDGFANQTVVAEIDDPAAAQTLNDACGGEVEVVGDDVVADMLALWMARPGAAELMRQLLSVDRIRLDFCAPPATGARSFSELRRAIDRAVPIGIRRADGAVILAPPSETVPAAGELLVCLSDGSAVRWDPAPAPAIPVPAAARSVPYSPQTLMLIGFNRIAPGLLFELDRLLPAGSSASILCDSDLLTTEQIAIPELERLAVTVTHVPDPELKVVAALADRPCSAIAVLAHEGVPPKDADAITLATLMAVGRAVTATAPARRPFVVAELTNNMHAELATFAGADETVARSSLLGDAITFAAISPEARPVLTALQQPTGPSVRLLPASGLGLVGEHSVAAVAARTDADGLLAIGTRARPGDGSQLRLHVRGNDVVRLGADDEVAVIG
jgi:hypothetical protein